MFLKLLLFINALNIHLYWCHLPQEKPIECLIHNQKYSYEYLYASDDINSGMNKQPYHNVYTYSVGAVDDFDRIKWTISQTFKSNATVTIKSNQDEYLCSSETYQDIFRHRRKLYLKSVKNKALKMISPNCHWRLEQIGNKTLYVIWNDWHNEPLYAPTFFYKQDTTKRNVFLWRNSPSSSGQYKWFIDCSKGDFLLE